MNAMTKADAPPWLECPLCHQPALPNGSQLHALWCPDHDPAACPACMQTFNG